MSDILKAQAKQLFATGKHTKAELARKFNVSPRTIGRWLENDTAPTKAAPAQKATPAKPVTVPATQPAAPKKSFTEAAVDKLTGTTTEGFAPILDQKKAPQQQAVAETPAEYSFVCTSKSVSITKTVGGRVEGTVAADRSAPVFQEAVKLLMLDTSNATLEKVYLLLKPAEAIKVFSQGQLTVDCAKNEITYRPKDGAPFVIDNSLAKRILGELKANGKLSDTVKSLVVFLENLMLNSSYRAVNELYGFLEANCIEITNDGHFIAFKKVRPDYKDIHSGTFDNSPGQTLRVMRSQVDENSERTCSHGLHCCSKSYLPHFGSGTSRVVRVKVHPADVVAIPRDYNNAKMRCCGYTVIDDVTDKV